MPAEVLAKLYGRRSDPPSKATIWRVSAYELMCRSAYEVICR